MTNKKTNQDQLQPTFSFPNEKDTRDAYNQLDDVQMRVLRAYYAMADNTFTTCWANAVDIASVARVTYLAAVNATLTLNSVNLIHPNPDYAFKAERWATLLNPNVLFGGLFSLERPTSHKSFDNAVKYAISTKGPGIAAPLSDAAELNAYLQRNRINTTAEDINTAMACTIINHLGRQGFTKAEHWDGLQIAIDMGVAYPNSNPYEQAFTRAVVIVECAYTLTRNNDACAGRAEWLVVTAFNAIPGKRKAVIAQPLSEKHVNHLLEQFTNI